MKLNLRGGRHRMAALMMAGAVRLDPALAVGKKSAKKGAKAVKKAARKGTGR